MATQEGPRPVQVALLDKSTNNFELNREALEDICNKCGQTPVCVVSIAGAYRGGKSFMLNFFLRYLYHVKCKQEQRRLYGDDLFLDLDAGWLGQWESHLAGFSWQSGSKPHTTGIWFWNEPICITVPNGTGGHHQQVAVLLMDTQGSFDDRQTMGQIGSIFSLSTYMSSMQVFNIVANIKSTDLDSLALFLGAHTGGCQPDQAGHVAFQDIFFLVRDWYHTADHDFGESGGAEYLKSKLELSPEDPDYEMRLKLTKYFHKMSCFLMPHPGKYVCKPGPFRGELSSIDVEFVEQLRDFVPRLLNPSNLIIKHFGAAAAGQATGQSLLMNFTRYAQLYRDGKIPEVKSWAEAIAETEYQLALDKAKQFYELQMGKSFHPGGKYLKPAELQTKHNVNVVLARCLLQSCTQLKIMHLKSKYLELLDSYIDSTYENFKDINLANKLSFHERHKSKIELFVTVGSLFGLGAFKALKK